MARKVNATFQGSITQQTDPGYPSQTEVIENAVGDTALTADMLTGDNTPGPGTIDHTGSGLGVPLGLPLGNRAFWVDDQNNTVSYLPRVSSYVASGGAYKPAYLFMIPIYLPTGETSVRLRVSGINDAEGGRMVCKNTSWADAGEVGEAYNAAGKYWEGEARSLTGGSLYFLGMKINVGPVEVVRRWSGVSVYFPGSSGPAQTITPPEQTNANWPQVPVNSQAGASSSVVLNQEDFDASMFADDTAYHAFLTTLTNHNQNALTEFLTGSPACGNAAYTLTSSTGSDPASSAFHDHSVSTHTNEGELDFPILAVPLGATEAASISSPDYATSLWGAPACTSASATVLANDVVMMPDFPDGTSTSRLKCVVLLTSPDGSKTGKTNETIACVTEDSGGVNTSHSSTAITWMGTSDWGYAVRGGSGNRMDFDAGAANQLRITVTDADGASAGVRARWVGYCWYFDGDG